MNKRELDRNIDIALGLGKRPRLVVLSPRDLLTVAQQLYMFGDKSDLDRGRIIVYRDIALVSSDDA